jgi:signal peptidase I
LNSVPKRWLATLLALINPIVGLLYAAQGRWALVYAVIMASSVVLFYTGAVVTEGVTGAIQWGLPLLGALQAFRAASRYPAAQPRPAYSRWPALALVLLATLALMTSLRAWVAEPFRAAASSMSPTITPNTQLMAWKWGYGNHKAFGLSLGTGARTAPVHRGDIVAFEFPSDRSVTYTKRVIGLPGDQVVYRQQRLQVNGVDTFVKTDGTYNDNFSGATSMAQSIEQLDGTTYRVLHHPAMSALPLPPPSASMAQHCTFSGPDFSCQVPPGHFFMMGDNRDNSLDSRYWGFLPDDHLVGKVTLAGE